MNTKLFFVIFAGAVVILSIITIPVAPNINDISGSHEWRGLNCKPLKDEYDFDKNRNDYLNDDVKDQILRDDKRDLNKCNRHRAMNDLEYTSLIMDLVLGFICCILGLLHYFDIGKYFEKITGIIGLASGIIGFILTIIYVGYSGYIFDNETPRSSYVLYSNGARFRKKNGVYELPYDTEKAQKNDDLLFAKYKDLGKKQYNYNSDLYKDSKDSTSKYSKCSCTGYNYDTSVCQTAIDNDCEYVWMKGRFPTDSNNKYIFDRWLTSIIFSCLIFVCDLGLALFGFLLFKGNSGTPS